jgi:hypothetical protein
MKQPKKDKKINRPDTPLAPTPVPGQSSTGLPKGAKAVAQKDRRPEYIQKADSIIKDRVKKTVEAQKNSMSTKKALKNIGNELFVEPFKK